MTDRSPDDLVLSRLLSAAAKRAGDRIFLEFDEDARTFPEADKSASRLANALKSLGAGKGHKVAIMAENSLPFVEAWLGAARAGAIYVPINTDYLGDILSYQLGKADVSHIVVDPAFLERIAAVIGALPQLKHVILTRPSPGLPGGLLGHVSVSLLAELGQAPETGPGIELAPSDPLAISFTSGTTGPSKGVLASNAHVAMFAPSSSGTRCRRRRARKSRSIS